MFDFVLNLLKNSEINTQNLTFNKTLVTDFAINLYNSVKLGSYWTSLTI